jgi:alanine racemase
MAQFLLSPDFNVIQSEETPGGCSVVNICHKWKAQYGILKQEFYHQWDGKIEKVIRPTIGILTNIGSSHDEGL